MDGFPSSFQLGGHKTAQSQKYADKEPSRRRSAAARQPIEQAHAPLPPSSLTPVQTTLSSLATPDTEIENTPVN